MTQRNVREERRWAAVNDETQWIYVFPRTYSKQTAAMFTNTKGDGERLVRITILVPKGKK